LYDRLVEGRFGKLKNYPFSQSYHKGKFSPSYFQDADLRRIIEAYLSGQKNILIAMATGVGEN
jgi:type I site-specific restriction endonuclease